MNKAFTIVIEADEPTREEALQAFVAAKDTEIHGCTVTAMSLENEMHRLELIESAMEEDDGLSLIREILDTDNIEDKTLEDFLDD